MNTVKIIISPKSVIVFLSLLVLGWIIYQARDVILLLFAAFIIASALFPVVDWLNKRMPRGVAVALIYLLGFVILATILIPFIDVIIKQAQEFIAHTPVYFNEIQEMVAKWKINFDNMGIIPDFSHILSTTSTLGPNILSQSINITIGLITSFIAAFTLAVLVLFLLLDKEDLKKGFLNFFPEDKREKTDLILSAISRSVGGYVLGQLFVMATVGIMTTIGLTIIGVNYALLLGMVAGILEIIPIVGPILASIPAIIVALAQNPWLALWVIVIYIIVHRIENTFLSPVVFSKFLDLHPLIIITSLLVAATTLGVVGIILAPPLAAVIYILIQELYLKKVKLKSENKA